MLKGASPWQKAEAIAVKNCPKTTKKLLSSDLKTEAESQEWT
jgi:hypothetical protein